MGQREDELERTAGGVVIVKPKPNKGLASKAIDWLEWAFVKLMHDPKRPLHYLSGNFAPVDETPPLTDLPVKGHLPECLNGEFVRVGPNPKFAPVAGYHWFDGDGMIHGLRIKDGKATYVSRFVKTSRLKQEDFYGGSKFMKVGDLKGMFGLIMVNMQMLRAKLKVLDVSYGVGTANTALVYHQGKLLALSEADKPYAIKVLEDGDLQTIGMLDYDKRLTHSFTAHPKVDPFTGEMFTFGYSHSPPYITYRVISKEGIMQDPVPITVADPIMMHDFAITENYAVFMDLPLHFRPKEMVKDNKFIFSFDPTKKARFGILPRYAKNELLIRWFELPNCFIFHNANAWEEGDEVVLITCRLQNPDLDMVNGPVKEKLENFTNELYEMRFNLKSGLASQKRLSVSAVDFPRVNESYTGRKQRYVYGTILDSIAKVTGIIKFDLHAEPETGKEQLEVGGNVSGIFDLGPGRFGSEAIFVPRQPGTASEEDDGYLIFFVHDENTGKQRYVYGTILGSTAKLTGIIKFDLHAEPETGKEKLEVGGNISGIFDLGPGKFGSEAVFVPRQPGTASDEDDGYLIFFVHDENTGKSAVNVIDAKTMSADPVAVVELPKRVPYGFHAFFVTEDISLSIERSYLR
ncbi:Carotenoid 9,10(9',10')-cleavage dioxygenase [Sesamum alatum]|uniref:carotenoid 9,10-dioxygenase n=1 Tax=Sesamum alatum TaxID=300844 RepID=A0AAE1XN77_9LAMI|nr:Carotenoid 9,10(9',10')-cleavage dioxygenase [Sesamum alatum]